MTDQNKFSEIMSKKTDEQLIRIVTVDLANYDPLAILAAEAAIKIRNIDPSQIEATKNILADHNQVQLKFNSDKVSSMTRFVHFIVDSIIFCLLPFILALPLDLLLPTNDQDFRQLTVYSLFAFSFFAYFVLMEYFFQKTIGKFITKCKVVKANGERPSFTDIISRTFFRLMPFDRLSFLFMKTGLHDYLSKTIVIKDRK